MRTRQKIIFFSCAGFVTIIAIIVVPLIEHYLRYTTEDLESMCLDYGGTWDNTHDTCDKVSSSSCIAMRGEYLECKPHEYRCPFDNPDCTLTAVCFSTCLFEQSLSADFERWWEDNESNTG